MSPRVFLGSRFIANAHADGGYKTKAIAVPDLNLDGDEQEEYSTMVETGEPSEAIVNRCLIYFQQFESRAA